MELNEISSSTTKMMKNKIPRTVTDPSTLTSSKALSMRLPAPLASHNLLGVNSEQAREKKRILSAK